ncbi:prolyl oligopeptidase family protein [Ideonella sp. A 288]|uniref:prolyl oligopeptidase family serine peptidase n=1 Tax=Ideonella sp. A 288 TaxID=1962181 RepID=UPI000B4A7393|nr:prolyl oligopeptidase family serine peptidase [Ideonella sp. A 288]
MQLHWLRRLAFVLVALTPLTMAAPTDDDPFLWLEDVQGERALAWVRERNAAARKRLEAWPAFESARTEIKAVLDSRERIPMFSRRGEWLYNLWQDERNPRGLWRRTTLAEYRKPAPAWHTLLDIDALGKAEGVNWVWGGAECLGGQDDRCLLSLSRGGADAKVVREFDIGRKAFVEGGFTLPEAKSDVAWLDRDTLLVGTDFGPGSLTDSGYPRLIKRWARGKPLSEATTVFEGEKADVAVSPGVDRTPGFERVVLVRAIDFYNTRESLWRDGKLTPIDKPDDAQLSFWRDRVLIKLRSDWVVGGRTWPRGALLVSDAAAYLAGKRDGLQALFTPTATRSLDRYSTTRSQVLLDINDNVAGRAEVWRHDDGQWRGRQLDAPFPGTLSIGALHDPMVADDPLAEAFTLTYTDFLTPDSLSLGDARGGPIERLKSRPTFFDATGMRTEQRFVASKDGTRVPYFVVWPQGAKADGSNPTLLYGYGGFQNSVNPWYSGGLGTQWYRRGGVLVVANIRGGGEYGPGWHQAAVKANKQRSYDDFIAVAEDLIATKVTSPKHLGIQGGSNGGLLVGAVMVQRPELFNAVVCQVPLLDMKRYHLLLAGASWMAEYGNPDVPEEWAWISKYSPYQNVKADATYPVPLIITSTRDDRVHPGHARKMAARMLAQGHEVIYHENIEGGHGAGADNFQHADRQALEMAYLWQRLAR